MAIEKVGNIDNENQDKIENKKGIFPEFISRSIHIDPLTALGATAIALIAGITVENVLEMREDSKTKMDHAEEIYNSATTRAENNPNLEKDLGQEGRDIAVQALKEFPVEQAIAVLSDLTGLQKDELIAKSQFQNIALLSDLDWNNDDFNLQDPGLKSVSYILSQRMQPVFDMNCGGHIGINLSSIARFSSQRTKDGGLMPEEYGDIPKFVPRTFQMGVEYALVHSFVNSWNVPTSSSASEARSNKAEFVWGVADAIALRILPQLYKDQEKTDDNFVVSAEEFAGGGLQFAEVFLASVDSKQVMKQYLEGNLEGIRDTFDGKFGENTFENLFPSVNEQPQFPFVNLLEILGKDAPTIIDRANDHLERKIHASYEQEKLFYVELEGRNYTVTYRPDNDGVWRGGGYSR